MLKNILVNYKNISITFIILNFLFLNYACSTSKTMIKQPDNIIPTKLYDLPNDLDTKVLIPDKFAVDILKKYESENWVNNPWVYKLKEAEYFDKVYFIDANYPEKMRTSYRNMRVVVPFYRLNYRCHEGGWFQKQGCFITGSIYLDLKPKKVSIQHFWKNNSEPLSHEEAFKELDLDKYRKCVFIVGGENENPINYVSKNDGIK